MIYWGLNPSTFKLSDPPAETKQMKSTMSPTEEETIELFNTKLQIKVIEWDLFINRLKKSFPVPDAELEEMSTKRKDIRNP